MRNITFTPCDSTAQISKRALEILAMSAQGMKGKEIARTICRTEPTIRDHHTKAIRHYGASNLTQAVATAIALGDLQFRIEPAEISRTTHRATAIAMVFAALVTTVLDTPFFNSADIELARHHTTRTTRTIRVRGGRRELSDIVFG